jgi:hypothetical protein
LFSEGDIPEAILKSFLAVDAELKTYGNSTELTGSTGINLGTRTRNEATFFVILEIITASYNSQRGGMGSLELQPGSTVVI